MHIFILISLGGHFAMLVLFMAYNLEDKFKKLRAFSDFIYIDYYFVGFEKG